MPIHPRRPRFGRLLDVLVIALCLFVLVGLGLYHYSRLGREQVDPAKAKELAERKFQASAAVATNDWPNFRGPNFDGVSTETDIITTWPKAGPKLLWEAPVGKGFASVAVSKGRVFTIFQKAEEETVVSWDAASGNERWRFAYPCHYKNSFGDGPRATPTVDANRVYTIGGSGMMYSLDADSGKEVWSKDLLKEFAAPIPEWGIAFSPLVVGQRVFVMPGGPGGNSLAALDKDTGAILWRKHDDPASYASPIPATFAGEQQILFLTGTRLVAVAPDTGAERWSYPWPIQQNANIATPIVVEDYVFLSSYYGKGCGVIKVEKAGDAFQPSLVYAYKHMKNHISTSVLVKDHIYGFDDKRLKCMNFRTGEILWQQGDFDKGSLLAFNDHLIIYGANGILALAEANPAEYVEKTSFDFSTQGKSTWSVPVLADGRLYVRDWERLVCFDVREAKK